MSFSIYILLIATPIACHGHGMSDFFTNHGPRKTPVRICSAPNYALQFQLPTIPNCQILGSATKEKPVDLNITTWWPTAKTKTVQGYECFGKKRYKRFSYFLHMGYSRDNEIWNEPVGDKACRSMLATKVDPQGHVLKLTMPATWSSDRDYDLQYVYTRTVDNTWWTYTLVSRTLVIHSDSNLIWSAAPTASDCYVKDLACSTQVNGVLIWDEPPKTCEFKNGPSETCVKFGDSVSCPGGLGWAFQDITTEKHCGTVIAKSGTQTYFTPDSSSWNASIASSDEFNELLQIRKVRQTFSPGNVFNAQNQFQHDMYRNISNTLAFEIFQRTCQLYAMYIRIGIYEALNGNPNQLLESMLGPGYVGTLLGDVIGVSRCAETSLYKFLPRTGKCTVEWPIEVILDGKKVTGWLTPCHDIIFYPTYIKNCRDYYFTEEGISYKISENGLATELQQIPHKSNVHIPFDLKILERLPSAPGMYTRTELTDNPNIHALMREVRHASALHIAVEHYMDYELNSEDESLLELVYNATVKPLADKITAFFATAGTVVTVAASIAALSVLGFLKPLIEAITGAVGPIFKAITDAVGPILKLITDVVQPIMEEIMRGFRWLFNFILRRGPQNVRNQNQVPPNAPLYPQLPVVVVPEAGI